MGEAKPMIAETSGALAQRQALQEWPVAAAAPIVGLKRLRYRAVWRSKQLLILPIECHPFRKSVSAVLEGDRDRLLACLKHSTVRRLLLSPELPTEELKFWAELGRDVHLPVYMRKTSSKYRYSEGVIIRLLNMLWAGAILFTLSPVMLSLMLALQMTKGRVFERELCVGQRGHFYRALKFSPSGDDIPGFLGWLTHSPLCDMPRLINVLRGEEKM